MSWRVEGKTGKKMSTGGTDPRVQRTLWWQAARSRATIACVLAIALALHASFAFATERPAAPSHEHHQHQQQQEAVPVQAGEHAGPQDKDEPTESERRHVPPPPPERPMRDMSAGEMIELMDMDDTAAHGALIVDQLEWREIHDDDALLWDAQAWYGDDYDKLWFKGQGDRVGSDTEGRNELLWDRIVTRWWNLQAGVRHDFGEGPSRTWAAFGVQGLAPYWFEVEATGYVGEEGRTAARAAAEYDLLLTQRLVLQPEIELSLYGKEDFANGIGSGLSDVEVSLRLRYEFWREFAPYVGVAWTRLFGDTADIARQSGADKDDLQVLAGLRVWF